MPDTIADRMPPMSVYTSGIAVDTIAAIHQSTVLYSSLQTQQKREKGQYQVHHHQLRTT
jgi:hypothetical protein